MAFLACSGRAGVLPFSLGDSNCLSDRDQRGWLALSSVGRSTQTWRRLSMTTLCRMRSNEVATRSSKWTGFGKKSRSRKKPGGDESSPQQEHVGNVDESRSSQEADDESSGVSGQGQVPDEDVVEGVAATPNASAREEVASPDGRSHALVTEGVVERQSRRESGGSKEVDSSREEDKQSKDESAGSEGVEGTRSVQEQAGKSASASGEEAKSNGRSQLLVKEDVVGKQSTGKDRGANAGEVVSMEEDGQSKDQSAGADGAEGTKSVREQVSKGTSVREEEANPNGPTQSSVMEDVRERQSAQGDAGAQDGESVIGDEDGQKEDQSAAGEGAEGIESVQEQVRKGPTAKEKKAGPGRRSQSLVMEDAVASQSVREGKAASDGEVVIREKDGQKKDDPAGAEGVRKIKSVQPEQSKKGASAREDEASTNGRSQSVGAEDVVGVVGREEDDQKKKSAGAEGVVSREDAGPKKDESAGAEGVEDTRSLQEQLNEEKKLKATKSDQDARQLSALMQIIKDAEKNILLLNRVRMRALEEVEQTKTENEVLQGQLRVFQAQVKESEAKLKLLTQVTAKNALLQEQVDVLTSRVTEADLEVKRMSQLKGELLQVQQQLRELRKKYEQSEAKAQEAGQLESSIKQLAEEMGSLKSRLLEEEASSLSPQAEQENKRLRKQVAELQEQVAASKAALGELGKLQERKAALEAQVEELESSLSEQKAALVTEQEQAKKRQIDEESEDEAEVAFLRSQIEVLKASLQEQEAEREVAARAQAEKDVLRQQVELLKQRLLESDAELTAQLEMYQQEVEQFQLSLERLQAKDTEVATEVVVGPEQVVSVPVGEMPWEFWSNLLLRIDALMLQKRLTMDQGVELRLMAWHRDARIRDAYEVLEQERDEKVAAELISLVRVKQRPGMHIVHVAAEMAPVAKVGGLADVVTGLGRALQSKGHLVEFILPKYDCMDYSRIKDLKVMDYELESFFDGQMYKNKIWRGIVEGLPVHFIEPLHPGRFFWRGCYYGCNDDFKRFTYFCRAALEFLLKSSKYPDVIHCHDWQTAAVAPLYRDIYVPQGLDTAQIAFTCHNFEYQGTEAVGALSSCGLDAQYHNDYGRMRDNFMGNRINLLKGGVVFSDVVTTVSPTYAQEVMGPEGGRGLHPTLKEHVGKFKGILNGIDEEAWNPMVDPMLEDQYTADDLAGKLQNKRALKARLGLSNHGIDEKRPLVGCVTRLVPQKGVHLIRHAIYHTVEKGGQFVLLGNSPVPNIQLEFEGIAWQFHDSPHVRLVLKYDEGLSHLIYAGSDMFIIPSMFEPCGLTQLIAMRYGSIPIARKTGGLNDSVFDVDDGTIVDYKKNGFTFSATDEGGLNYAMDRAFKYYWERPDWWKALVVKAMKMDFSWDAPSEEYLGLYQEAVAKARKR